MRASLTQQTTAYHCLALVSVPLHHFANLTVNTATSQLCGKTKARKRDERERSETRNQEGLFLLKSRSFKLIRSQITHHYAC